MALRTWSGAAVAFLCLLMPAADAMAAGPPPSTPQPIAAKRLVCGVGQTDVNTASAAQLVSALHISLPVAQRVVAHREPMYLDLEDLLTVEGIGPGGLAAIQRSGAACADLPSSPPPIDAYVCQPGDGRVDVNRPESRTRLAALFGKPTADRIVAGIPYAGVAPVVAEHVPGVGSGKQRNLLDQLCDTPPTIDHGAVRWGWISRAGGRVDHPDGATLTVGAGVVDDFGGSWGSVRPMAYESLDGGPKFDMTVHGPWQGNGDTVFATLPADPFQPEAAPDAWRPTVLHGSGDAIEIHTDQSLYVGPDGRWTAAVTSLSPLQSILQPLVSLVPFRYFTPVPRLSVGRSLAKSILDQRYDPEGCSPDAGDEQRLHVSVTPDWLATGGLGGWVRPMAQWCAEGDASTNHLGFELSNVGMPTFDYDEWAGPADTQRVSVSHDLSPVTRVLLEFYNRGVRPGADSAGVVYGPGVTVHYDLPASDQTQEVQLHRASARTAAADTLFIATEHLGAVPGMDVPAAVIDCIKSLDYQGRDFTSVLGCVEKLAREGSAPRRALEAISRSLDALSLLRSASEYAALLVESSHFSFDGDVTFKLRPYVRPAPGQPSSGDPSQTGGVRILKRSGSTAAYVLDSDGIAHHIPDGGTYICNAMYYMVQYNVDEAEWAAQVHGLGDDASCPSGEPRGLAPESVPAGMLLRRTDGQTYLTRAYNGAIYLVPLFSGQQSFDCMVEQYLVWDQVSSDEYERFDHHPVEAATGCGSL